MNIPLSDYKRLLFLDRHGYFSREGEQINVFLGSAPPSFLELYQNDLKNRDLFNTNCSRFESEKIGSLPDMGAVFFDSKMGQLAQEKTKSLECYPPVLVSHFWQKFLVDIRSIPVEEVTVGIHPWEMAFCSIDQEGQASIKVRKYQKCYSKVSKEAVLTHEFVHALRGRIFSTKYEEIIAYAISAHLFPQDFPKWRTWLSPLFSSTAELVCSFVWMMGTFIASWVIDTDIFPPFVFLFSLLPIFFCTYRLYCRWNQYNKVYEALFSISPHSVWPLMLRLTDEDIDWLASLKKETVAEKISTRAKWDWRWYFLKETFL